MRLHCAQPVRHLFVTPAVQRVLGIIVEGNVEDRTKIEVDSERRSKRPNAECTSKAVPTLHSGINQVYLTSTAVLRESIHQRSRSNRHSGPDYCRQTVFTVRK